MEGDSTAFLFSITIPLLCGIVLGINQPEKEFGIKEAFNGSSRMDFGGVFGALPFVLGQLAVLQMV